MSTWNFLNDQMALLMLLVLVIVVLGVLALVVRAASQETAAKARNPVSRLRSDSLRSSFRQAIELIESNIADRSERYSLPWILVLDEGNGEAMLPLGQAGIASALSSDASSSAAIQGMTWHFFDKGITIDVQSAYLGGADHSDSGAEPAWEEFLSLCRDYRPERPFDAMVLTVPAALLSDSHPDARMELVRLAKRANRRLWLAQNRFAMRFGISVVISGCEAVPGFSAYARALPDVQRSGMLGWSSPHDINALYRQEWIDEAIQQTVRTLSDSSAELFALNVEADSNKSGSNDYFLLPSRIDALRPQLQIYMDELMRPSSYHEPFLLRGLYFSGDASEVMERLTHHQPATQDMAEEAMQSADTDHPEATISADMRQPVFLRELFEQKVFAEIGLTRPSGTQHLDRSVFSQGLRWGAWGVAGIWCVGLIGATIILTNQSTNLQRVLTQIRAETLSRGETLSAHVQRDRTLALLQLMEQLDNRHLWSVFMPGSWPAIDSLTIELRHRLETTFGEVAVHSLRQGLYERTARLTGVAQDASTGQLIMHASCTPFSVTNTNAIAILGFEDLPIFTNWLEYLSVSAQIDQAIQALQRLQDPTAIADPRDLALVVRVVLDTELPDFSTSTMDFFRTSAARQGGLGVNTIQTALRCGLGQIQSALLKRAFDDNDLLHAVLDLDKRLAGVASGTVSDNSIHSVQDWRDLLAQMKGLDTLLTQNGGAWMHKASFQPGSNWNRGLARIETIRLLGSESANQTREESGTAFTRFATKLSSAIDTPSLHSMEWSEKDSRWVSTPEIVALRTVLQDLFAQPWMRTANDLSLSDNMESSLTSWDLARLDQALSVGEQRKHFQAEWLARIPIELRAAVETLANQQFAGLMVNHLNQALIPGGRSGQNDPAAVDAERNRLARVQTLLRELGARHVAEQVQMLGQRDVMARLRSLDDKLERAELYMPQSRGFSAWGGEKAPALAAFGLPDASALTIYLSQQRTYTENLARDAEMLLGTPSGSGTSALSSFNSERWNTIIRDLERYRLKNPNSSLLALETFLTTMATDVDASNCNDRVVQSAVQQRSGDYFAQRQQQLTTALRSRCQELRGREQREQWEHFTTLFNRIAAGRPPFATPGWPVETPPMGTDELAQLLGTYDRAQRSLRDVGRDSRQTNAITARRFLDQFERINTFLQPLVPAEEGSPSGYDMQVEFRANAQGEVEGQNIIDWAIDVGGQHLGWRETPRALHWEPGQPISLSWRLAKDGPVMPKFDDRQSAMHVDQQQRVVTLRYTDHWALLSLLMQHRDLETVGRRDPRSQLLHVEFPLAIQPDSPGGDVTESRARVYLRLTLSPTGKRGTLTWPGSFPTRAPEIQP